MYPLDQGMKRCILLVRSWLSALVVRKSAPSAACRLLTQQERSRGYSSCSLLDEANVIVLSTLLFARIGHSSSQGAVHASEASRVAT